MALYTKNPSFYNIDSNNNHVKLIIMLDSIIQVYGETEDFQMFAEFMIKELCLHVGNYIAEDGILFKPYKNTRTLDVIITNDIKWSKYVCIIIYCLPALCNNSNLLIKNITTISPFNKTIELKYFGGLKTRSYLKIILKQGIIDAYNQTIYINKILLEKMGKKILIFYKKNEKIIKFLNDNKDITKIILKYLFNI